MQGTWVRSLVQEDSKCRQATKTVCRNYWSLSALEPMLHSEKPLQWETHALQAKLAPTRSLQLEKAHMQQQRPSTAKNK